MRTFFGVSLLIMIALTVLAVGTLPESRSDLPLLWWTSDPNPARGPQIAAFEKWMKEKSKEDSRYRPVRLQLDSNNMGTMKVIIQSASGVGSDIVDVYGGGNLRQYVAAGVLMDVTDLAKEYGFGPDKTYAAAREELFVDGRQYAFPCNVTANPLTINRGFLEREGLPLPKYDWTWDEFLEWCLKVRKVDHKGNVIRYAIWPFNIRSLWPTNGGTIFNETLTRSTLDSQAVLEATNFYYDLMFKYKVMPTPMDRSAMASQSGYGGSMLQWIGNELVVAVGIGRYGLIQLRKFKNFKPDVSLFPYKIMPMQFVFSRAAGINASSRHKRLAVGFLEFLADTPYNKMIIGDADALPPNPQIARTKEFLAPSKFPNERGVHEKYLKAAEEYGVGQEYSRFISPTTVDRIITYYDSGISSRSIGIKDGLNLMANEINREIQHAVKRDPKLKSDFDKALARQAKIDALKASGEPVPIEMVDNPVIRKLMEAGKWR